MNPTKTNLIKYAGFDVGVGETGEVHRVQRLKVVQCLKRGPIIKQILTRRLNLK
jgi:hypothetical protein